MKIAITGATGFVGSRLVEKLNQEGHQILIFTRNPQRAKRVFPISAFPNIEIVKYNPKQAGDWQDKIFGCDGVVNLAGEPIAERWSQQHKQEIKASRELGTKILSQQ